MEILRREMHWNLLLIYIWYVTIACLELISCRDFTIIYDRVFHQTLTQNALIKDSRQRVSLLQLDQNNDLKTFRTLLKNVSRSDVVLLFTKYDRFFEKMLHNQHLVLTGGVNLEEMVRNFVHFLM